MAVAVVERLKQESMYGLSLGTKKWRLSEVAFSGGLTQFISVYFLQKTGKSWYFNKLMARKPKGSHRAIRIKFVPMAWLHSLRLTFRNLWFAL